VDGRAKQYMCARDRRGEENFGLPLSQTGDKRGKMHDAEEIIETELVGEICLVLEGRRGAAIENKGSEPYSD